MFMQTFKSTTVFFSISAMLLFLFIVSPARAGAAQTYLVVYKGNAVSANAANAIAVAGGSIVYSYPQIGVIVASSDNTSFGQDLLGRDSSLLGAVATGGFSIQRSNALDVETTEAFVNSGTPVTDNDSLSGLQWDMVQIHSPEAHAVT